MEELTSTVTYTVVVPSVTLVVSSEVATTLFEKDLMDRIRDKFLMAEVPRLILVNTLLILGGTGQPGQPVHLAGAAGRGHRHRAGGAQHHPRPHDQKGKSMIGLCRRGQLVIN